MGQKTVNGVLVNEWMYQQSIVYFEGDISVAKPELPVHDEMTYETGILKRDFYGIVITTIDPNVFTVPSVCQNATVQEMRMNRPFFGYPI